MKWSDIQDKKMFFAALLLGFPSSLVLLFWAIAGGGEWPSVAGCIAMWVITARGLYLSTDAEANADYKAKQAAYRAKLGERNVRLYLAGRWGILALFALAAVAARCYPQDLRLAEFLLFFTLIAAIVYAIVTCAFFLDKRKQ